MQSLKNAGPYLNIKWAKDGALGCTIKNNNWRCLQSRSNSMTKIGQIKIFFVCGCSCSAVTEWMSSGFQNGCRWTVWDGQRGRVWLRGQHVGWCWHRCHSLRLHPQVHLVQVQRQQSQVAHQKGDITHIVFTCKPVSSHRNIWTLCVGDVHQIIDVFKNTPS